MTEWPAPIEYDEHGHPVVGTIEVNGDLTVTESAVFNEDGADEDFRVESDDNANMIFVDAGNDRVGIGTATPSATLDVAGDVEIRGQTNRPLTGGGVIRNCFVKALIADNTATAVFTITCTNETGDADAGGYSCYIRGHAQHAGNPTGSDIAAMSTEAKFNRSVMSTGAGVNSAVKSDSSASSATGSGLRDIASFAITVTETSEYVNTVNATVDLSGSNLGNAFVVLEVTLLWYTFTTPPVLAAA
jgi:hypothetical protein